MPRRLLKGICCTYLGVLETRWNHVCPDFLIVNQIAAIFGMLPRASCPIALIVTFVDHLRRQNTLAVLRYLHKDAGEALGGLHGCPF
jgi:hypothetical protein